MVEEAGAEEEVEEGAEEEVGEEAFMEMVEDQVNWMHRAE